MPLGRAPAPTLVISTGGAEAEQLPCELPNPNSCTGQIARIELQRHRTPTDARNESQTATQVGSPDLEWGHVCSGYVTLCSS
jgi:hypothetical protein